MKTVWGRLPTCPTWLLLAATILRAQTAADPAVAMVVSAAPARLLRAGTQLEIDLRQGDLLFAGDRVTADEGNVVIWHCPASQSVRLERQTVVRVEARRVAAVSGQLADLRPILFCPVPPTDRAALAKPAFYGQQVSRTRGLNETIDERATLAPAERSALEAELRQIDQSQAPDPNLKDAAAAAVLARHGLHGEAASAYGKLAAKMSNVDWPRLRVHEEHESQNRGQQTKAEPSAAGQTFALLVGVSEYERLPPEQRLEYPSTDAEALYNYVRSPRGGSVPEANIRLLTNSQGTAAAIRTGIADFLRARAGKNDTVLIFLATHGVVENDGAYVVAYDSDPENLKDSGISMVEIQSLMEGEFANVGQVLMFIDVCHAGLIGNIKNGNFGRVLQILGRFKGEETFGLLASGPGESSLESSRFGGGHGAFTYFLLRGLNGDADEDADHKITVNELQAYVYNMVRKATKNKQNPRATGDMPGERVLVQDLSRTGIELADWQTAEATVTAQARALQRASRAIAPRPLGQLASLSERDQQEFEQAIAAGRLLGPGADSAVEILRRLTPQLAANPLQLLLLENRLRTELQNRGQEVLLRYLRGEDAPQRQEDFEQGGRWFESAWSLDPEAVSLEGRAWFCEARAMLFQNRFNEARDLLERAVRIEPNGPYLYNALGLLYLQQAAFPRAASAFRDAIRLAPNWAYPRHNLALALTQAGSYDEAVVVYRDAQKTTPGSWYIPYNLGLVQQRINRPRDAEASFRKASLLAPARPEPETALGFLAAFRGRSKDAERFYRDALAKQAAFLPARHNLALLLSETGREDEGVALWQAVLTDDPGFVSSRMALASTLERRDRKEEALAQYRLALDRDPEFTAARLAAGRVLLTLGRATESEKEMRALLVSNEGSPTAWEALGDALAAQSRKAEAGEAYARAAKLTGGAARRDVERKSGRLRGTGR